MAQIEAQAREAYLAQQQAAMLAQQQASEYAQQLGDAARARADAEQRAHHAELQLQERLAGNARRPPLAQRGPASTRDWDDGHKQKKSPEVN